MTGPNAFAITQAWKPQNPELLYLFSFPAPNGVKVSIAPADANVKSPEFLSLDPNNKTSAN